MFVRDQRGATVKQLRTQLDEHGLQAWKRATKELIESRRLTLSQLSLQSLAEHFLGGSQQQFQRAATLGLREGASEEAEHQAFGKRGGFMDLRESGMAVGTTAFINITGQLIFSEVRDAFDQEDFVFTQMIPVVQSRIAGTEIVPGITRIGDQMEEVGEGQDYPEVGIGETRYLIARKRKRGGIVSLTEEAVFFDLTDKVVEMAREVGSALGLNREKELIDVFIGAINNYQRNGVATATYLAAGAYVNDRAGVTLDDWTDVETLELGFDDVLDPDTGEPIVLRNDGMSLVTTTFKAHTARQILGATQLRGSTNTTAGAAARNREFLSGNTLSQYPHTTSRQLLRRLIASGLTQVQAREYHWLVDWRAFAWYENWPLRTFQQGADSESGFNRDVTMRFKASQRGVAQSREPRLVQRGRNT